MTDEQAPQVVDFDPESITFDEAEELERITGRPFGAMMKELDSEEYTVATIKAMVFIALRRTDPDLTPDDVTGMPIMQAAEGFQVQLPKDPATDG